MLTLFAILALYIGRRDHLTRLNYPHPPISASQFIGGKT